MNDSTEDPKPRIKKYIRHYQVLILSVLLGIIVTTLAFGFNSPIIPQGWATGIVLFLLAGNIFYDLKRNNGCSKCGEWMNVQQTNKIEKGGMLMPNGFDSMRKYKCSNCGHTWTEFYRARKHHTNF